MITCDIKIDRDIDSIYRTFLPETTNQKQYRASYTIEKNNNELHIKVSAKDMTSFRAIMSSVVKLLSVYQKIAVIK
jgi:tRNA threonylcarbamoyladenosine modification (KEOPS) complex  Pcc1 subunit